MVAVAVVELSLAELLVLLEAVAVEQVLIQVQVLMELLIEAVAQVVVMMFLLAVQVAQALL
jgi:hypothetical protein